jgi:hypothetical protein
MLDTETLLRESSPQIAGMFLLNKAEFIIDGVNSPRNGRCDTASYAPVAVAKGTEYMSEMLTFDKDNGKPALQFNKIKKFEPFIDASPSFFITYIEFESLDGNSTISSEVVAAPSSMWVAKSIFQQLKNMREWAFIVEEPFNSVHPMALCSKTALEELSIPVELLEEIDSWPDMHLARFFKGDSDYKKIPHPYPPASQQMKDWVVSTVAKYGKKSIEEQLDLL